MATCDAIWCEKHRPKSLLDKSYIYNDKQLHRFALKVIQDGELPHVMFHGPPGTGKSAIARAIVNDLGIEEIDLLIVNASDQNSVDNVRDMVKMFVGTWSMGDYKVVLFEECLDEGTLVNVLRDGTEQKIKIKDLDEKEDLVKTFNIETETIEWLPFKLFDKDEREVVQIEFENGQKVICTEDHKWYIEDEGGEIKIVNTSDLHKYGHILTDRINKEVWTRNERLD